MMRARLRLFALLIPILGLFPAAAPPARALEPAPPETDRWCAPELDMIADGVCFSPAASDATTNAPQRRTLVIFLHSLLGQEGSWRWEQQRLMARIAKRYGVSALMPRGRGGVGPGRDPKVIAWPTSTELQKSHEDAILAEWLAARDTAEGRVGKFERVLVFGFSNGAYYAASLALRGRLDVDGYGVFAGGSGGKYMRLLAARAERRAPIFVGYGTKDPDHRRQRALVRLLRELGWKHSSRADRIGHTVSDAQLRSALAFLTGENS